MCLKASRSLMQHWIVIFYQWQLQQTWLFQPPKDCELLEWAAKRHYQCSFKTIEIDTGTNIFYVGAATKTSILLRWRSAKGHQAYQIEEDGIHTSSVVTKSPVSEALAHKACFHVGFLCWCFNVKPKQIILHQIFMRCWTAMQTKCDTHYLLNICWTSGASVAKAMVVIGWSQVDFCQDLCGAIRIEEEHSTLMLQIMPHLTTRHIQAHRHGSALQ